MNDPATMIYHAMCYVEATLPLTDVKSQQEAVNILSSIYSKYFESNYPEVVWP